MWLDVIWVVCVNLVPTEYQQKKKNQLADGFQRPMAFITSYGSSWLSQELWLFAKQFWCWYFVGMSWMEIQWQYGCPLFLSFTLSTTRFLFPIVSFFKSTPEEEEEVCSETVRVLLFYQFDICHYFITSYKISCVNFSCKILICLKSDSGGSVKTCSSD